MVMNKTDKILLWGSVLALTIVVGVSIKDQLEKKGIKVKIGS